MKQSLLYFAQLVPTDAMILKHDLHSYLKETKVVIKITFEKVVCQFNSKIDGKREK